jgi:hypothetical protein
MLPKTNIITKNKIAQKCDPDKVVTATITKDFQ